jgi:hypothetical protein
MAFVQPVVGDRCVVQPSARSGAVAYVGPVTVLPRGVWVGVRLDEPTGKNDGSVKGERCFTCEPKHGAFVMLKNITVVGRAGEGGSEDGDSAGTAAAAAAAAPAAAAVAAAVAGAAAAGGGAAAAVGTNAALVRIEARNKERQAEKSLRRAAKADELDPAESTSRFWESFNAATKATKADIAGILERCGEAGGKGKENSSEGKGKAAADAKQQASAQGKGGAGDGAGAGAGDDTAAAAALSPAQASSLLDELALRVRTLDKQTAGAARFLPGFDVRLALQTAAGLGAAVAEARHRVAPRRKFTFGARQRVRALEDAKASASDAANTGAADGTAAAASCPPPGAAAAAAAAAVAASSASSAAAAALLAELPPEAFSFSQERGKTLVLREGSISAGSSGDGKLSDLTDCVILLMDVSSALRCDRLTRCKVLVGPVAGSVHLQDCKSCVFMLASRQVRIHDTYDTDFYLRVASNPIFEDCCGLRFAPYRLRYPALNAQMEQAGLGAGMKQGNMWHSVDDFKWHRAQHSPNWSVLPEAERSHFRSPSELVTMGEYGKEAEEREAEEAAAAVAARAKARVEAAAADTAVAMLGTRPPAAPGAADDAEDSSDEDEI